MATARAGSGSTEYLVPSTDIGTACTQRLRKRLIHTLFQRRQPDVLEFGEHRVARVKLQGQDAFLGGRRVVVGEVEDQAAVEDSAGCGCPWR